MFEDLKGKTALITGSGKRSGIGYGIADKLASLGTNIIIADLGKAVEKSYVSTGEPDEMQDIAKELADKYKVQTLSVAVDVCDGDSVKEMAKLVKEKFSRVDILCNNAGSVFGVNALSTYNFADWEKTIDVNLHGVHRVTQAILPMMFGKPVSIINTSSRAAKVPPKFNGAYAVAKAGVIMYTKVLAKELGNMNIRVNAICPGQISTELEEWRFQFEAKAMRTTPEERKKEAIATIPVNRLGTTDDVANLVAFLSSDASSFMTGQAINITGGQLMEL